MFFFFKQKTAYEMRISDWSSDVCSSDLIPTDNLYGAPVMSADIQARFGDKNLMVVSPDVGGVVRARALAKRLDNAPLAIVDKRRERAGESEVMNIIGDVKDRFCILIDDIVDSAGTLCNAAADRKSTRLNSAVEHTSELQSLNRIPYAA